MKNGVCPKCGAEDVRVDENRLSGRNALALTFFGRPVKIRNYICVACGYLENYIQEEDLAIVAKECKPAESAKKR